MTPQERQELSDVTPDTLYSSDDHAVTFCYWNQQRPPLIYDTGGIHSKLMDRHNWGWMQRHMALEEGIILGRTGMAHDYTAVAVWNDQRSQYPMVKRCLKALMALDIVQEQMIFISPVVPIQTVGDFLGISPKIVQPTRWTPDMMSKLHTLPPAEKKTAMQQMNMGWANRPTARPGVKWLSPTSEGLTFKSFLKKE